MSKITAITALANSPHDGSGPVSRSNERFDRTFVDSQVYFLTCNSPRPIVLERAQGNLNRNIGFDFRQDTQSGVTIYERITTLHDLPSFLIGFRFAACEPGNPCCLAPASVG